jgi:4-amino-4-deoxy-L-arabinose transferase-like glycosyltransferase
VIDNITASSPVVIYSRSLDQPTFMTRTAKLLLVPILLLQVLFFTFIARHRFIDGDEGFYLLASRLVLMHKKPYLDFFYTQAPLLPYVYALWMKCTGVSWVSAKLFSALLTALFGTLLYAHVCRQTRNWLAGLAAAVLFASSTLIFAWFPVVKPYSLAGLLLFSAYVIVSRLPAKPSPWLTAAGGLLLGLSVDTRSYLLLLTPLFLWWIFHNSDVRTRLASILWFMGGFSVGIVPCLYLFICSPPAFLFNNLGYHAIRSGEGLIGSWSEKFVVVIMMFLGGPQGNGIQNSILFFITVGFVFSLRRQRGAPRLAFQIALVLGIISLLPTPAYPGYFSLCVPFLVVSAVCVVNELFTRLGSRRERLVAAVACVAVLGVYVATSTGDFRKYLITGDGIAGVRWARDKGDWKLQRVLEVSQAIDQIASPGEMVASFWPGYIFQTKATPFPGFENDFALPVSEELTSQQRARYHIISPAEIEGNFAAHTPRVVVLGNQNHFMEEVMGETAKSSLRAHGYASVRSIGDTSIYVCCSKP